MPVSTTASVRNCTMMSRRRAPTALRMPISLVRSVTDTSMMFITPMPPTSRPMELSTTITSATVEVMLRNCSSICSPVEIQKSVRLPGRDPPLLAQHRVHLVHRLAQHPFVRHDDQHVLPCRRKHLLHRVVGQQRAGILLAGKRRRRPGHHAHHLELCPFTSTHFPMGSSPCNSAL